MSRSFPRAISAARDYVKWRCESSNKPEQERFKMDATVVRGQVRATGAPKLGLRDWGVEGPRAEALRARARALTLTVYVQFSKVRLIDCSCPPGRAPSACSVATG